MASPQLRKNIAEIKEYTAGKSLRGKVKLSSNENPFGPSPKALKAIARETKSLQKYPEQKSTNLRQALALKFGVSEEHIICGNGSDDLMQMITAAYLNPGDEVITSKHSFSVYELVARLFAGRLIQVEMKDYKFDLDGLAAAITGKTKIIFLTNPNNPTGTIFSSAELEQFLQKVPGNILVVMDEAYAEFVESKEFPDSLSQVQAGRNLIVLRTFSKFYGLAGLRIGYAIGPKEIISPLFKVKMPFNVNRLAQAGAIAALQDSAFLKKTFKNNLAGKYYLYTALDKLELEYKKSEANFIFINLKRSAEDLFLKLVDKGIIIRPLTSFGLPEAIRVSIGTRRQNKQFITTLKN